MNDFVYSPQALISKGNRFTGNRYPSKYPHWHPPHPQLPCSSFALFCLQYFFYHWCFMPVWLSHTCRGTLFSRPLHKQLPTSFFPHTLDSQTIWKKKKTKTPIHPVVYLPLPSSHSFHHQPSPLSSRFTAASRQKGFGGYVNLICHLLICQC